MRRALLAFLLVSAAASLRGSVVVLGDSVARGAGDESGRGIAGVLATISQTNVVNLGVNGARTRNVLQLLAQPRTREAVRRGAIAP